MKTKPYFGKPNKVKQSKITTKLIFAYKRERVKRVVYRKMGISEMEISEIPIFPIHLMTSFPICPFPIYPYLKMDISEI
jgi:hypothetical protein